MRKANHLQGRWRNAAFFLCGLLVVVADQLSKTWIRTNLAEGQSLFEIGFLQITRIHNTGAAFGLFRDQTFALTIIALIGIGALLVYVLVISRYFSWPDSMLGKSTLGLVLGGTIGNLIDRLCFGYVIDFISFSFWPAFNIADSAITIGAIIFVCSIFLLTQAEKH